MSAGIDYGMGTSNVDKKTGIRYGVISQHSVSQAWLNISGRRIGGLYFVKIGRFCFSFCLSREYRPL